MMLSLQHITLRLKEFTLEVHYDFKASVTGILGPSGSGKTTLLEIIAGLRGDHGGKLLMNGEILADSTRRFHLPPEKRRIGYVPQDLALFPHLDVSANLNYALRSDETDHHREQILDMLEISPLRNRRIQQLSGGEKQRVAIGRALFASPQFLLLDEPLSSLDPRLKQRILPYLQHIRDVLHIPMLYVSHQESELRDLCDEILVFNDGQIEPHA